MRDFRTFVQQQVAPLALPAECERKVVDEWAAQLEDMYDALVAEGRADEEAWRELQRQIPDWHVLGKQLVASEPAIQRLTFRPSLRDRLTAGLARDLHASFRLLVRDRVFTLTTILTLAVCLGANAAIFTVVYAVLLRPLPMPEADRIVAMGDVYPTVTPNDILANDARHEPWLACALPGASDRG